MMKKFYFLPLAFAGLLLTGCSSDDATAPTDGHVTNLAEGGYVSLAINLPTQNANVSRAANDNFEDGLPTEYAVKSAKLLLFQAGDEKAPEGDATFHSAYNLHFTPIKGDDKTQVTVTSKIVKKLTDKTKPQALYALVVLNDDDLITGTTENGAVENVKIGTTSLTENTKFSDIQKLTLDGDQYTTNISNNGLLMLNAPLMEGGVATETTAPDGKAHTLAVVTDKVFNTEAKAQAAPAANVYVERAAAKVTFKSSLKEGAVLTGDEYKADGNNGATVPVKITGWALNVINKKTYLVHNVEGFDTWKGLKSDSKATTMRTGASAFRFAGTSSLYNVPANGGNSGEKGKDLYRIYWGEDPNYSTADPKSDELKANFTTLTPEETTAFTNKFGDENPKYCNENTFNVAAQKKNQTTSIIVQAQVGNGEDYYVVNNDKSKLYTLEKLDTLINSILIGKKITKADVLAKITYKDRNPQTGKVSVEGYSYTADGETKNGTPEEVAALNQTLGEVTEYVGGKTYYSIPIKHFGDDLTPWGPNENGVVSNNVYPANDHQDAWYLGRYGVLRNNWYDVSVTGIKALGSAVVPTPDNTPDDDYDNYLSFRINVLSWAKRSQSVDL